LVGGGGGGGDQGQSGARAWLEAMANAERTKADAADGRVECPHCGRRWNPRVAVRHLQVCSFLQTPHRSPSLSLRAPQPLKPPAPASREPRPLPRSMSTPALKDPNAGIGGGQGGGGGGGAPGGAPGGGGGRGLLRRSASRPKGGLSLILAAHSAAHSASAASLPFLPPLGRLGRPGAVVSSSDHTVADAERKHARDRLRVRNASLALELPADRVLY
jgi:hypothetical protein